MKTIINTSEENLYLANLIGRGIDTISEQLTTLKGNPTFTKETRNYLIQCRKYGKKLKSSIIKRLLEETANT